MKALITTIALASTLAAGTASATNFEVGQLGGGIQIQSGSHYSSEELVTIDHANLPANQYGSELFIGSK